MLPQMFYHVFSCVKYRVAGDCCGRDDTSDRHVPKTVEGVTPQGLLLKRVERTSLDYLGA